LLEGKIGKYTVLARRAGKNWFAGAVTDWDKRDIDLETDFLAPGKYRLEAIVDGINADKRAEDYRKTTMTFNAGDILKISLAPGGGWVARIMPE
jgi:alpha-glucosidase